MFPSIIHKFSVKSMPDMTDSVRTGLRYSLGLPDLDYWRDYYIEFEIEPTAGQIQAICGAMADNVGTLVLHNEPLDPLTMVQIAHRTGVVDNECSSILTVCELLGTHAVGAKAAETYRSTSPQLKEIVSAGRYNRNIAELRQHEPVFPTLRPVSKYMPARRYDLTALSSAALEALGRFDGRNLSLAQMRAIRSIQLALGQEHVTDVLLEALDARWSDHCAHTTWRSHGNLLAQLAEASAETGNPNIVSMFHDNAGVWDFYGGYALAIKAETHNGPSAVSAYFGQLTKLGGVLRDILGTGQGADPIGAFEYTATGLPSSRAAISGRPAPRHIALETIRAIKEYGNTFGVPMMRSHMTFATPYRAKPFALGGSVGLIPKHLAQRGIPKPGDLVVLIGALTGNDGIHGASASSAGATMHEASVQIGAPLEQVKFRKAIVELRDAGCVRAITDLGGAGLNSAVGEIGEHCGVWINTALVPLNTLGLPMWRILLSESQERMLVATAPHSLPMVRRIMRRHQVRMSVIGRFTSSGRYHVFHDPELTEAAVASMASDTTPAHSGETGFDVPYALLSYVPEQQPVAPPPHVDSRPQPWPDVSGPALLPLLERIVADPEIASQRYADSQYDSTVQGNTVHGNLHGRHHLVPSSYWAGTPVHGSPAAAVLSTAFNPWLFEAHPVRALRQMFCAALNTQVLAGVALQDICLCDNFYTPQLAEHASEWLVAMVEELSHLVRYFRTPVISGKDSSGGSVWTDEGLVHVPPAVFLTALGKVSDYRTLRPEMWSHPGNVIVQIGLRFQAVTATVLSRAIGISGCILDDVPLDAFRAYLDALCESRHLFHSARPLGYGGIAGALVTSAFAARLGIELVRPDHSAASLFAEHRCGALVEIAEAELDRLPVSLQPLVLGRLVRDPGIRLGDLNLLTPAIEKSWTTSFEARLT